MQTFSELHNPVSCQDKFATSLGKYFETRKELNLLSSRTPDQLMDDDYYKLEARLLDQQNKAIQQLSQQKLQSIREANLLLDLVIQKRPNLNELAPADFLILDVRSLLEKLTNGLN